MPHIKALLYRWRKPVFFLALDFWVASIALCVTLGRVLAVRVHMAGKKASERPKKTRRPKHMGGGTSGLAQRIRELRTVYLRLKQSELAMRIDVATNAVSLWERDKLPTLEHLRRLAETGGVTLDWLVEGRETFEDRLAKLSPEEEQHLRAYIDGMLKLSEQREARAKTAPNPTGANDGQG